MDIIYKWFTALDVEKLSNYVLQYTRQKMLDTKELENFPFANEKDNIKKIIEEHIGKLLFEIQEHMNIEEVIPCTEKEKKEILSISKREVKDAFLAGHISPGTYSYYFSWINTCRCIYEHKYFPCMVKYYNMIYPTGGISGLCLTLIGSAQIITGTPEDKIRQEEAMNNEMQKKFIETLRESNQYKIYFPLMLEQGKNIHKNDSDIIEKMLDKLFYNKPPIDQSILESNWGTIIYELVITRFYIAAIDKKLYKKDKIIKRSYDSLKKACQQYISSHNLGGEYSSKWINVENFIDAFKIYTQIDSRLGITYSNSKDSTDITGVYYPDNMHHILFELAFNNVTISNKGKNRKIYSYEVIKDVIEEIKKNYDNETSSIRQILYNYNTSYLFSYEVFYDIAQRLILDDKEATGNKFVFDVVEEWNRYTGQLITNSIWSALIENKENDFFILAHNSKVSQEDKEKLDKALYSCIEKVVDLKNYFSYVETSILAYKLFSCIGIIASKIKKDIPSAILIFETMSDVLKNMHSDITYEFWESQVGLADEIEELKNEIKHYKIIREIYNEYFVREYTKAKPKDNAERSKEHLLYKKIEKAVLYNLHKEK